MKLNLVNSIKKSQPTFGILILFFKITIITLSVWVFYLHLYMCYMCTTLHVALRGQEKEADLLQLKLHAVVE